MKPPSAWCPEKASMAYIDTVKLCGIEKGSSEAEFLSAMAAGLNAKLIVEAWAPEQDGCATSTSVGLGIASRHSGGRHVCVVPDHGSKSEYVKAVSEKGGAAGEVVVGEAEEAMSGLKGIDFLVVDCRRSDCERMLRSARLGDRGTVLVRRNAGGSEEFRWESVLGGAESRFVRSVYLPAGKGVEVAHLAAEGRRRRKDGNE